MPARMGDALGGCGNDAFQLIFQVAIDVAQLLDQLVAGVPEAARVGFEQAAGPTGALCVGAPATVAAKIVRAAKALKLSRFDLKYSNGTLAHDKLMRSIELYATEVVPLVHQGLA